MKRAHIIIIGKTGAGKSTLVNAIVGKKVAPTGIIGANTKKNNVYTCEIDLKTLNKSLSMHEKWELDIYDTVGLELNEKITENTLREVEQHLITTRRESDSTDVIIVWLCISHRSNRCEEYELAVVDKMSLKYEVPFSILLTQCISDEESDFERQLRIDKPGINVNRLLAEDYRTRAGVFSAFGVDEVIRRSICDYNQSKIDILEEKLEELRRQRSDRIKDIKKRGTDCINKHEESASHIGIIPAGCIPFVHGICIKMLKELDSIAGIDSSKGFAEQIFANVIVAILVTPFMVVPGLSVLMAPSYVGGVGESYLEALMKVIERSTDDELKNTQLVEERIREELERRKN